MIVYEPDRSGSLSHDEGPFRHVGRHLNRSESMSAKEIQQLRDENVI